MERTVIGRMARGREKQMNWQSGVRWYQRSNRRRKRKREASMDELSSGLAAIRCSSVLPRRRTSFPIPLDLNGLADPLVLVEVLKNKRFTKIKAGALSATFNELFTFNFDQLETGDLEAASIKITVYDADTFTSNDLVGAFSLSVPFVYAQPDHELHRQWLMLTDLRKADGDQSVDVSKPEITGKLRCSVAVLGANDKQKFHDELEDVKAELYRTDDDVNAALMPSFLAQKTAFLKLTIYRAEHLPVMDLKSVLSRFSGAGSGELTAPSAATDPDLYN
jgi:hypothetical protein